MNSQTFLTQEGRRTSNWMEDIMKTPRVLGTRTSPQLPRDEESKASPVLLTAASLGARGGRDLRRDSYTDGVPSAKVLPEYADSFPFIKRSAALISTGREIRPLPFRSTSRPRCDEPVDGAMQSDFTWETGNESNPRIWGRHRTHQCSGNDCGSGDGSAPSSVPPHWDWS